MLVLPIAELPSGNFSHQLVGAEHGDPGVSVIVVDAAPGQGPGLHTHPYAEVFVVQEGVARFSDGETERDVGAGHVVIVPAGQPHSFTNPGPGRLRQVDVHVTDSFDTTYR